MFDLLAAYLFVEKYVWIEHKSLNAKKKQDWIGIIFLKSEIDFFTFWQNVEDLDVYAKNYCR